MSLSFLCTEIHPYMYLANLQKMHYDNGYT